MSVRLSRLLVRLEAALDRTWSMDAADALFLFRCW
jgi:hypothetical protein